MFEGVFWGEKGEGEVECLGVVCWVEEGAEVSGEFFFFFFFFFFFLGGGGGGWGRERENERERKREGKKK